MTVPADEPQTRQDQDQNRDDLSDAGGLAVPAAGLAGGAGQGGGGGLGVPLVAGLLGADDDDADTPDEDARDAGEHEVGASDGPVGGTTPPR